MGGRESVLWKRMKRLYKWARVGLELGGSLGQSVLRACEPSVGVGESVL